jgi:hypothetical protein
LLGLGYKLEQIVKAAEETRKIRKSRQASMKGTTLDKFRSIFDNKFGKIKISKPTPEPKVVASKTA